MCFEYIVWPNFLIILQRLHNFLHNLAMLFVLKQLNENIWRILYYSMMSVQLYRVDVK